MKVELPKTIQLASGQNIALGKSGHIVVPDKYTGGDFEKFFAASQIKEDDVAGVYQRQWEWARDLIVEWAIEGLPTNPNQFKPDDLTWAMRTFLTRSVIDSMNKYRLEYEEVMETIEFPQPETLLPSEFFAWRNAYVEADELREKDETSNLKLAWLAGSILVRAWPNGGKPKDYESADLKIVQAIDALLPMTITPALDLGNWRVPLGET